MGAETARIARFDGGVPERSKGADCKSAGSAFEGSNPSPSTSEEFRGQKTGDGKSRLSGLGCGRNGFSGWRHLNSQFLNRGCSSMVEQKPSKLMTRVRFPSPAPEFALFLIIGAARSGSTAFAAARMGGVARKVAGGAHVAQW